MDSKGYTIIAIVKAKEDMAEVVKKELLSLVTFSRSEKGCIQYHLHQSMDDKTLFMFYEKWISKDALQSHLKMPYMKAFMEKADTVLSKPIEITSWEMMENISEGSPSTP